MFSANLNYEQTFSINDQRVSGINNFNGSLSVPQKSINILGAGHTFPLVSAPPRAEVNFNRYFISQDMFLPYTGDSIALEGGITYKDVGSEYKTFSFENGYLTQHSISCSLGRVPQTSTNISVFGDIGSGVVENLKGETIATLGTNPNETIEAELATDLVVDKGIEENPHPEIQIPNQGSISVECHGYEDNRVTDFQYQISVNRIPMYVLGKQFPIEVNTIYPIKIDCSFSLDVDEFSAFTFKNYLISPKKKDIHIVLNDSVRKNEEIQRYSIFNARLISQSMGSNSERPLSINLSYEGYINKN